MASQIKLMVGYAFWTKKDIYSACCDDATTEPKQTEKRRAGWCDLRFQSCNRTPAEVRQKKNRQKLALGGKITVKRPIYPFITSRHSHARPLRLSFGPRHVLKSPPFGVMGPGRGFGPPVPA